MINYDVVEKLHDSENGSKILKVKGKDDDKIYVLKLIGPLKNHLNNLIFKREINSLITLNKYDDIIKIYDSDTNISYGKNKDYGGILLEYIEGTSLDQIDLLNLSELQKFDLCLKISKAIANAHSNGILHRDIKPQNIMCYNDKIKIIDFGSSKIKALVEKETTMPLFSCNYSAPEVVAGGETFEYSDIYSLGVIFFEILLNKKPMQNNSMIEEIEKIELKTLKTLLIEMLQFNPEQRLNDINKVICVFEDLIGILNVNAFTFSFSIDYSKLQNLKREFIVEDSMTMQQFLSVFLPREFSNMFGIYDEQYDTYKFIGDTLYMECLSNEKNKFFSIVKIYMIPIDRRVKLQKIYCELKGKKEFKDAYNIKVSSNNNLQLKTILANHATTLKTFEKKNELFNELFGKWMDSLVDSIDTIKSKSVKITYKKYEISDGKLLISIDEYKNGEIDNINVDTRYIFEEKINGKPSTFLIGTYEDVSYDDNEIKLIISLAPKTKLNKIVSFLNSKQVIYEDYLYKINSYRRQITALSSLRNNECSSKNLKDIILELEKPTSTSSIKSIKYYFDKLNSSQKQAVNKAIYSESISLIQGPPGTGKTKVINEIISQITLSKNKSSDKPRILVVSQSHTAVDNILESIANLTHFRVIRIGDKKNVSKKVSSLYLIDAIRDNMFSSVKEKCIQFLNDKMLLLGDENPDREKWLKIKTIQEDWIKRCGDYENFDYQIINSASIIAGTCIGFLSNEFIRDMYFDYVIVDEAAKATTPELLVSIIKAKKIILVGDQNQLPPFADESLSKLSGELVKNPKYRLFDILFEILPETHKQTLTTQYRMTSNIGNLISTVFYEGTINTGIDDSQRLHNIPFYEGKSIIWYNTSKLKNKCQSEQNGKSFMNQSENRIIKDILYKFNQLEIASEIDIGIITGYSAQKNLIRKSVNNSGFSNIKRIDINTLDAFQGRENNIIIYSTVRTSKSIGFQKEKERINVAFSRAKSLLIICGDLEFFYSWNDGENKYTEVINYIKNNLDKCQIIDLEGVGENEKIH